ncbi:MAG TPA: hypothetical protein DEA08_15000 [Planctomycetes bacterium]|nr:hypothetical protein [Planctomycetota bacterium]
MPYDDSFRGHEVWKLRKYSIALPNGPDGFENALRDNAATVAANTVGATHNKALSGLYLTDWKAAVASDGVERVSLEKLSRTPATGGTFTTKKHSIVLRFVDAGGFLCHFLPWDDRGGAVYMELDDSGPNIFFTAALSGCSVMVDGNADNPTVYHFGCETWTDSNYVEAGNVGPPMNETHQLWEDLFRHHAGHAPQHLIDKRNYVNDFNPNFTTANSRQFETQCQNDKGDPAAQALPWGIVFGLRDDNDDWAFYLQENATFRYKKKEVKWSGLRPRRVRGQFREQCRPMNLKQFFPAVVDNAPRWTFG